MDYKMREIKESESVLSDFLYEAVFIPEGMEKLPKSIMEQLELQIYVASYLFLFLAEKVQGQM